MPGLNMGIIKGLEIPLPPIDLQEQFKRIIAANTTVRLATEESQKVTDDLFGALQQRAYRGGLDLSRLVFDSPADVPSAYEIKQPAARENIRDSATLVRRFCHSVTLMRWVGSV